MCVYHLCTTVIHNTAQNSSDIFPLILQTAIIAQMVTVGDRAFGVAAARVWNSRPSDVR